MSHIELNIKGMTCDHCKMAVTNALEELNGIQSVDVSVEKGKAAVTYDESSVNVDQMKEAVEEQGYDVVG